MVEMSRKRKAPSKTGAARRLQARAERHLVASGVVARVNAVRLALNDEAFPGYLREGLAAAGAHTFTSLEEVRVVVLDVLRVPPFCCDLAGVTLKLGWDPKSKHLDIRAVLTMETAHEALAVADHSRRLLEAH
jgi:hypothetical protein